MKKQLLTILALSLGSMAFAQVGVNTATPTATFDIVAKTTTGTSAEGLVIPRVDRLKAQTMAAVTTSTMIYVNSIANGTLTGTAANIDAIGYYYFDGTAWVKLSSNPSSSVNLYNADGTLTGNRIVTQTNRTLAFTGTAANAFSVDGTTLSVNAANHRVGIGTITPIAPLEVNTGAATTIGAQIIQPVKTGYSTPGLRIAGAADAYTVGQTATIGFNPNATAGNAPISIGASYLDTATGESSADFVVATSAGFPATPKFTVKNNGNVGVMTITPQKTLHVVGDLQVTRELNVGGNATTAGSAGTAGQILSSNGTGVAPSWITNPADSFINLYTGDGALTGNRIVTQANRTLAFTGTAANAFSVDGTTLSVNAANHRIGIGTIAPTAPLELNTALNTIAMQIIQPLKTGYSTPGIRISGAGTAGSLAVGQSATLGFNPNNSDGVSPISIGASYLNSATGQGSADFVVATSAGAPADVKFTIKNNGMVGVLTETPQKTLHVAGDLQVTRELNVGGNGTTAGSAGTVGQVLTSNGAGNAPTWQTAGAASSVNLYNTNGALTGDRVVTQGTNFLRFNPTIVHGFSVNGNTFSVDGENSRIGINTITPLKKLHINGTMQLTNELNVGGTATTLGDPGTSGQILTSGGVNAAPTWENPVNLYVGNGALTSNRQVNQGTFAMRFTPTINHGFSVDGNTFSVDGDLRRVGIGTTTPEAKFHVVSPTQNAARYNLMDAPAGANQYFILSLRNTSAMAANNLSLLGFTNSGPDNGGANWAIGSIRTAGAVITGAQEDFYVGHSTGGGLVEMMRMKSNGNLGIGVTNPLYALDVEGVINASGNVRANGVVLTSDARLKQDIHDTSYGLNTVMALRPVEYQKKNSIQDNKYNKHEIGFLAQDVVKILPSLVSSGTDEFKTLAVSYTELIPILAKAIQEQQKEIVQLKADNEKLADAVQRTQTMEKEYAALAQQVRDMQRLLGVKQTATGNKVASK